MPKGIIVEYTGKKNIESVWSIFSNNYSVMLQSYLLGIMSMGLYDFGLIISNGVFIGSTVHESLSFYNREKIIIYLLPHGIFEIPAIILSMSTGFLIWIMLIEKLVKGKNSKIRLQTIVKLKSIEFIICTIYLFIAAAIESFVSLRF